MTQPKKTTAIGERARAVISFVAAIALFGMAALFYFSGSTVFAFVSVLPALFGLLMLYSTIHSLLAAGTPPTTIRLSREPLPRGTPVDVIIRQTGPVRLQSLRANLICERRVRKPGHKTSEITIPCQQNFFESLERCEVSQMAPRDFAGTVTVPADGEASCQGTDFTVLWRIEVWGQVEGRADFMRPFDVEVV